MTNAPQLTDLLSALPLAPLGPGRPDPAHRPRLAALGDTIPAACRAGLWLAFDFLEESHQISQSLPTPEGSFWHAIMHRREPDAWNSKYWWRKVGAHPVLTRLATDASAIGYTYTDPADFVDFCERVRDTGTTEEDLARRVQMLEWRLLFDHCHRATVE